MTSSSALAYIPAPALDPLHPSYNFDDRFYTSLTLHRIADLSSRARFGVQLRSSHLAAAWKIQPAPTLCWHCGDEERRGASIFPDYEFLWDPVVGSTKTAPVCDRCIEFHEYFRGLWPIFTPNGEEMLVEHAWRLYGCPEHLWEGEGLPFEKVRVLSTELVEEFANGFLVYSGEPRRHLTSKGRQRLRRASLRQGRRERKGMERRGTGIEVQDVEIAMRGLMGSTY